MSVIENALLEGVSFAKKFLHTFYSLIFHPRKVLRTIIPSQDRIDTKEKEFFDPFLFYVISTLPTVFVFSSSNQDFYTLSKSLPIFFNSLTIQKIFLITLPNMIAGYFIAFIGSLFFKKPEWKSAYKSFIYYSIALPLLALAFYGIAVAIISHICFHDYIYGTWEGIVALVLLGASLIIPIASSVKEKWENKAKHWIFSLTPLVAIVSLLVVLEFERNGIGYTRENNVMPDDLICEETDVHNFTPEIKMDILTKKILFTYSLWFFNPTNRIFWAPSQFEVDILNPVYYTNKDMRKKYPFLSFESVISKKHQVDSLMVKPNQNKKFEYTCLINRSTLDPEFIKSLKNNNGGNFGPHLKMTYHDVLQNSYEKSNNCNVQLVFDSTIRCLCPIDSIK